jgi:DNA modification methylase
LETKTEKQKEKKIVEINKIYNQDCYELLQEIESGTIDLLLQDTPFGCTQN